MKVPVEKYIPNFCRFFFYSSLKYNLKKIINHHFLKSEKNAHKSRKIYQNFRVILEDWSFKTASFKKIKNKKKLLECILYIEMFKKITHQIVRKIDSINKLQINKN